MTTITSSSAPSSARTLSAMRENFLAFTSRALLGAAAGGLSGLAVGGIGGRLAMLLLRLTSPDTIRGVESDDGFEMGVVTLDTMNLLGVTAVLGTLAGIFVVWSLTCMPWRWVPWAWAAPGATLGGAALIHADGVDFTLVGPQSLAVALFVLIPAIGLVATALLIRRWESWWWSDRRRTSIAGIAAWPVVVFFPVGLGLFAAATAWAAIALVDPLRRLPSNPRVQRVGAGVFVAVTLAFLPFLLADLRAVL